MAHSSKAVIIFEKDFYKEKGLSGFAFSNIGPLIEIHDASTKDISALIGFFHSRTSMQKTDIKKQLERLFGDDASKYLKDIHIKDWREEEFTATKKDLDIQDRYFSYGYDLSLYDKKVYFAGTEASFENGGYLEGALLSAIKISKELL